MVNFFGIIYMDFHEKMHLKRLKTSHIGTGVVIGHSVLTNTGFCFSSTRLKKNVI